MLIWLLLITALFQDFTNKDFKLIESTSQKYFSGIKGGTNGIKYHVDIIVQLPDLSFDSLWVDGNMEKVIAMTLDRTKEKEFAKGDTVRIYANIKTEEGGNALLKNKVGGPIKINGKGLLVYHQKGMKKYFKIEEIKALKDIHYP